VDIQPTFLTPSTAATVNSQFLGEVAPLDGHPNGARFRRRSTVTLMGQGCGTVQQEGWMPLVIRHRLEEMQWRRR
jgi:hypothetical protein